MTAPISRALSFVPLVASVVFFAGCSPDALDLGQVTPPQPLPDPSITVGFGFEANEMPPLTNGSFTIGQDPITATFSGGAVVVPDNPALVRSPVQAWLISEGESGSVTFNTPVSSFEFFFRNEFEEPDAARSAAVRGGVECEAPPDLGNNPGEAFGLELFARGAFNDWLGEESSPPTNFVNLGGGTYRAQFAMAAGSYEFKLASEDWSVEYSDDVNGPVVGEPWEVGQSPEGAGNSAVLIPADGCYTWTVTVIDESATPAPVLSVLIAEFVPGGGGGPVVCEVPDLGNNASEAFGAEMFARGAFNDWAGESSELPTNFVNLGGGIYRAVFEMTGGSYDFKIASEDWNIEYSDDVNGPTVGVPWPLALSAAGSGNSAILIPADGCYSWTITVPEGSATPPDLINVLIEEFTGSGGSGLVGSKVTVYDVLDNEIDSFDGSILYRKIGVERDTEAGETLIKRIQIDNIAIETRLAKDQQNRGGTCPGIFDPGNNPAEAFGGELFARGQFNDWVDPPTEPYNFVNNGDGSYSAQFEMTADNYEYKIASADWGVQYADNVNATVVGTPLQVNQGDPGGNAVITIDEDDCYDWLVTVVDDTVTPAPTVELLVTPFVADVGMPGENGIGFVAIDDFEFTAIPQTEPRLVTLAYHRPDGDYSGTEFVVSGEIEGGDQTLTCEPLDGFCYVQVSVLPGGSVTYYVTNNDVRDEGGDITVDPVTITDPDGIVVTFAGSGVPLTSELPEIAEDDNEVILYYKRNDDDYEGWGLHLFPIETPDWTEFPTPGEYPYEGIDPVLGAYFIIALPGSSRLTEPYSRCMAISVDGCDLSEFPESLGFIIHKGNTKDPGPDQFVRIAQDGNIIFVRSGVNSISSTPPVEGGVFLSGAAAHWVKQDTLVSDTPAGVVSAQLLYSADGRIREAGGNLIGADMVFDIIPGTPPSLPNSTHLEGLDPWTVPADAIDMADVLITGQLLIVGFDAEGSQVQATAVQIPLLLDDLYADAARDASLGVNYSGGVPELAVWAPTSTMVSVNIYDTADAQAPSDTLPMSYEPDSGIWTITGTAEWDRKYYTYTVTNYVPIQSRVREQETTDPYSVNIAMGGTSMARSQMINLDDADLKPADWDTFLKPPLDAPEDIVLYELHIRDFSALDPSVMPDDQGKYTAFAGGGDGSSHLTDLAAAGLTHVHLLPPFDIATVNEDPAERVDLNDPIADLCALNAAAQSFCNVHSGTILEALQSYGPTDPDQAALVEVLRGFDSFNWGYDPVHFNVPEGVYASDANNASRILEFRTMVKGLSDNGLRSVIDQVYNHTNASGTSTNAVFDKVVPGYYHRYDPVGGQILRQSCCEDTASEHAMMEKFLVDSMEFWATEYKIDGFRLDLMSFHPLSTMELARDRLQALTLEDDGVDGSKIYIYGEGWQTGIAQNDDRFISATQNNLGGSGIGSFNDRIRDAVRGGGPTDNGQNHITLQGFISGLFYDPNANNTGSAIEQDGLLFLSDRIRVGMAGGLSGFPLIDHNDNATTGGSIGAGYTDDPQEIVNYVASHDGETLWDISQFKHAIGTTTSDRVRAHNLGNAIVLLGQGIPFLQAGQDMLRSKSMDRNTFDSGDWFNRLDFSYGDNNFAVGTPVEGENGGSLTEIAQVLANASADPGSVDIMLAKDVTQELLRIRKSSGLFRLRTSADVANRVMFHNTGSAQVPGLIVNSIDGCVTGDYTPEYGAIVTVINARTDEQVFELYGDRTFDLHPVQVSSVDATVASAFHDVDGFHVPARTAAVFVEAQSGESICGFGADFAESTAFVSGDFNNNAFVNAMLAVGDTSWVEGTVSVPVGADQRYRILSSDSASINCGGPAGGGALFTPVGDTPTTISCGAGPDELSFDSPIDTRYKFALDVSNIIAPSLVIREQAGTGFPVAGGGCGVADMGNNNSEFFGTPMFVRGSMNDWADPPVPEWQLINVGGGEFQLENEVLAGEYFFQVAAAGWAPQYGDAGLSIGLGVTETLPRGGFGTDTPVTLPEDGCYNFTFNPSVELDEGDNAPVTLDVTVSLIPQATGEPTDIPLVRGGFNDWGETNPMTMLDATTFEGVVTVDTPGDYAFKIASADWAIVNCGGPQDLGAAMSVDVGAATTISCGANPVDLTANFAAAGDYAFNINTTNRNNPTLTISTFEGAGFSSEGPGLPRVYVQGDFNAFGLDNQLISVAGNTLYFTTVALTAGTMQFRFESADGTTVSCATRSGGSSTVAVDTTTTIGCGPAQANLEVDIPVDGNYTFQLNISTGTSLNPQLTIISPAS